MEAYLCRLLARKACLWASLLFGTTIRIGAQPLAAVGIMNPTGAVALLCSVHVWVFGRASRRSAGISWSQIWHRLSGIVFLLCL
jgi:hypothetical protein